MSCPIEIIQKPKLEYKQDITEASKYYYDKIQSIIVDNISDKRIRRFCAFYMIKKKHPNLNYASIGRILCITKEGVQYISGKFEEYYNNEGYRLKESFELLESKLNDK